ncbi:NAD(P)-binding protein, partial [Pluteus cervinus]
VAILVLFVLYIQINDSHIKSIPDRANALSPLRWTPESIKEQAEKFKSEEEKGLKRSIKDQLPPKTGRRYIVVGGSGFLGGWIVNQLLERGETPHHIRLVDLRPPLRKDLLTGPARQTQFIPADVSSLPSLLQAFSAPWPTNVSLDTEITIFHTAANIRFFERHLDVLPLSTGVNVDGTKNVIEASKRIGATVLVYTSSASVAIRRSQFFLWPWQKEPKHFVQIIDDKEEKDNPVLPRKHEEYFSNYAVSKIAAEKYVREADRSPTGSEKGLGLLRTGVLRPGNCIYGPRGDPLFGACLLRHINPTWHHQSIQSFLYVENCALAHLLYEARLLPSPKGSRDRNPDIGGQFFIIVDPGPTRTYGDVYMQLETLSGGETYFPVMSATGLLVVAYLVEWYYLIRLRPSLLTRTLTTLLPPLSAALMNLQPALFFLTSVHAIFDDSRARLPPSQGGLGYQGVWTTFEGICKT